MLIQTSLDHVPPVGAILSHTPIWVWGLLAGLILLGMSRAVPHRMGARRVLILPVAMSALSLWGTASALGRSPVLAGVLLAWLLAAFAAFALAARGEPERGTRYDADAARFEMPGSLWPLALILAIFMLRYVVNAALAVQPALVLDASFGLTVGVLYGTCSGLIAGRTARLWRLIPGNPGHAVLPLPLRRLMVGDPW